MKAKQCTLTQQSEEKSKVRPFLLLLTFIDCAQFGQRPKERTHHGAFTLRFTVWVGSDRRYWGG